MTIEEIRGYVKGVSEVIDGDIPRKVWDRLAEMIARAETRPVVKVERHDHYDRYPWWPRPYIIGYDVSTNGGGYQLYCSGETQYTGGYQSTPTFATSEEAYQEVGRQTARAALAG